MVMTSSSTSSHGFWAGHSSCGWAEDGSLLAAAQQALSWEGEPQQLAELLDQWGSDFSALPAVGTLSSQDIAGARGAYVEDLSQIFLNQEWLAEASDPEISAVLTEELGHHLDAVLNDFDTPGDEGEQFAKLLIHGELSDQSIAAISLQSDLITILADGQFWQAKHLQHGGKLVAILGAKPLVMRLAQVSLFRQMGKQLQLVLYTMMAMGTHLAMFAYRLMGQVSGRNSVEILMVKMK